VSRKQHVVRLEDEERIALEAMIRAGVAPARRLTRARILLKADAGGAGPRWPDAQIAEAVEASPRTVARVRADFCARGLDQTLQRRPPTRVYRRKLDGHAEARLVQLACSDAPAGQARWSLRLLAARLVALDVVDGIAPETVRQTLKKMSSSPT
jgi:Homeodomain-like domain